jgi:chromosome segregation ATPase
MSSSNNEWETKYNALQKQFDEFQLQSEEFEQELEQDKLIIEKELEQKEQNFEKLMKEKNRLDDQLHREREKHSNSANDLDKYLKEIKLLKEKDIKHNRRIQELETANDNYENKLRIVTQDLDDSNRKLEEHMEENIFLKNDLDELKREYIETKEHLELEIKDQKGEIEFLKRTDKQPSSVTALKQQFEANNNDKNNHEDEIVDDMFNSREINSANTVKPQNSGRTASLPPPPCHPFRLCYHTKKRTKSNRYSNYNKMARRRVVTKKNWQNCVWKWKSYQLQWMKCLKRWSI